jgi:hypothetical protein
MRPEAAIQLKFRRYLEKRKWLVEVMQGNAYQQGIPDLFCWHQRWGHRWVDMKVLGAYQFTKAQIQKWPLWEAAGLGIWIIVDATDEEYKKLFKPPNMREYWKPSYDKHLRSVSNILEELKGSD